MLLGVALSRHTHVDPDAGVSGVKDPVDALGGTMSLRGAVCVRLTADISTAGTSVPALTIDIG
ncbi:hypothetical protein [Streptomyces mirabilis]|uniref:hypothetical protein n=1 Tax=Streptomyces mirabilis TaxID=68239 RepID=UPI003681A254